MIKITFMGAGSTVFARNVLGDCMCTPALRESEIALYDIDEKRLEDSSNNPLIEGEDKEDKIKKLLKQRDPVYAKFADVEMVTGDKPFEDLIAQLEEKLKTYVKNS